MNIKTADDELLITRTFDVPSAVLFALWSTPEHVKRWMGPADFTCPEAEIDFRVGGTYRVIDHLTAAWRQLVRRRLPRDRPESAARLHFHLG